MSSLWKACSAFKSNEPGTYCWSIFGHESPCVDCPLFWLREGGALFGARCHSSRRDLWNDKRARLTIVRG